MADYFTHFSCLLDVGTPDKAARALALFQSLREADQDAEDPEVAGFNLVRQDVPEGSSLWIHDDEHGDVEAVIRFVLRLAEELDLTGLWGVSVCADLFAASPRRLRRWRACHRSRCPQIHRLDQQPGMARRRAERGGHRCLR
ncbi:hypothetical protein EV216_1076 [Rhodovulum steppense]|uniref:Uncharacterized protein n=1 Tax=Rhodovulum steppense TaxID=540251 RepID=A0A4R1YW93_9RHOB|nr:hypothetical protein EV216_1076 [Rhodovulum steppense]